MTPPRSLVVVTAGLSQPSSSRLLGDRLAAATQRHLADAGIEAGIEVVEVRAHAHDLANNVLVGFPSPALQAAMDAALGADGLIAVSPIFNASYSGLFKLFWDVVERDGLAGMPVLIGATGGTARHSLALEHALRPLFAYLKAVPVPTGVFAASEDFGSGGLGDQLAARVDRAAGELVALLGAGGPVAVRRERPVEDQLADPTPFADLLARVG